MSWSQAERERQAKKRQEFMAQGLTSKGKERKGRAKPAPHQAPTFLKGPSKPEQVKQRPRTPWNVVKRPPKLPPVAPLTDEDRAAA